MNFQTKEHKYATIIMNYEKSEYYAIGKYSGEASSYGIEIASSAIEDYSDYIDSYNEFKEFAIKAIVKHRNSPYSFIPDFD